MDTHYHIWRYRRAPDGTIRSMERDDTAYPTRRRANYALSDGHHYWRVGQVLKCVDTAFCQSMPEEMADRGMPFGPRYVSVGQLAKQARSIHPAAVGRIKSIEAVRAELAEHQAGVDAELVRLLREILSIETEGQECPHDTR